jgi:hypothetical protein
MTEQIRQLADQAGIHGDSFLLHQHRLAKFAELIVQECVGVVEGLSPGYDDYRNQIEDAFRRDCVEQLKHKFEVKE